MWNCPLISQPLDSGIVSLAELAIEQKGTIYGLLTVYHQLTPEIGHFYFYIWQYFTG